MIRRRSAIIVLALSLGAPAAAGCGEEDDGPRSPPSLSREERALVTEAEGRIATHCVRVARALVDPREAPSAAQERRAFAAADDLAALAARKPTAPIDVGQDLRLKLSDIVENLEGSNCDPRMVQRLEQALNAIPNE